MFCYYFYRQWTFVSLSVIAWWFERKPSESVRLLEAIKNGRTSFQEMHAKTSWKVTESRFHLELCLAFVGVHCANGKARCHGQLAGQSQPPIFRLCSTEQRPATPVPGSDAWHFVSWEAGQRQLQAVDDCSALSSIWAVSHTHICRCCTAHVLRAGWVLVWWRLTGGLPADCWWWLHWITDPVEVSLETASTSAWRHRPRGYFYFVQCTCNVVDVTASP